MITNTIPIEMAFFSHQIKESVRYDAKKRFRLKYQLLVFIDSLIDEGKQVPTKLWNWIDYLNGV